MTIEDISFPTHHGGKKKQYKFIIGALIIVAAIVYLVANAVGSTGAYYRTPTEVKAQSAYLTGKTIRVSGKLLPKTIVWEPTTMQLDFSIVDDQGTRLPVHFEGVKPDNMTDQATAIVEGKLDKHGVLQAKTLLLKCPSRYEEVKIKK